MKKFSLYFRYAAAPLAAVLAASLFISAARVTENELPAADALSMLAAYIDGSGARDLPTMTAVGAVILNRCRDVRFPDSIAANASSLGILPSPAPSPMARYAARLARDGVDPTSGALTFFTDGDDVGRRDEYVTYSVSGFNFAK